MPPPSDLVRDSKLETRIFDDQTVHSYIRQRIYQEEYWKRERLLGRGSYGQVWLEKCTSSNKTGKLRAVKEIRKEPNSNAIEYDRELEAVAKFSHDKVS
jgi:serine/threonine protein kinase